MTAADRLPDKSFLEEPRLKQVLSVLNPDAEDETRVVGGAVRNALLHRPIEDVDCATRLTPQRVSELAQSAGFKVVPTGLRFGTVTVIVEGKPFEVTTLRQDVKSDGRWAEVRFGTDWHADASRRDFTMNALYCNARGELFDPLGGYGDVMAQRVRFIGEASKRISEDYLRVLRFFRFHAWYGMGGFDVEGFGACAAARAKVRGLSAERLRQELLKLLRAPAPLAALAGLAETGVLIDLLGVPQLAALRRLIEVEEARALQPSALRRLAALAVRTEEDGPRLGERLRLSRAEAAFLTVAGQWARRLACAADIRGHRGAQAQLGARYADLLLLAWALSRAGAQDAGWQDLAARMASDPVPAFPVKGGEVMGLGVSAPADMAKAMELARRLWSDSDFRLSREGLLEALKRALEARFTSPKGVL